MQRWAQRLPDARFVGIDLEEDSIQAGWAEHAAPNLEYRVVRAPTCPSRTNEFELASAIEVLEHVPDPSTRSPRWRAARARHLLVSVPREPLWRMLNMARGAYWSALGQHPGPPQPLVARARSWRSCAATARSSRCARRSPGRWCLSASSSPAPTVGSTRAYTQRRAHPLDRDRLDRAAHVRLLLDRQPRARRTKLPSASTCCGR